MGLFSKKPHRPLGAARRVPSSPSLKEAHKQPHVGIEYAHQRTPTASPLNTPTASPVRPKTPSHVRTLPPPPTPMKHVRILHNPPPKRNSTATVATLPAGPVTRVMDRAAAALGGYDRLDFMIAAYNPAFYSFVAEGPLTRFNVSNLPTKFLFTLIVLGAISSIIPLARLPLEVLARLVGVAFMFDVGRKTLTLGFAAAPGLAETFIIAGMMSGFIDLLPPQLRLDENLGALRALMLPMVVFIVPGGSGSPVAGLLARLGGRYMAPILKYNPTVHLGLDWQAKAAIAATWLSMLFWMGYLGARTVTVSTWAILAFETLQLLATPQPSPPGSRESDPAYLTRAHSLVGLWLWRLCASAFEHFRIPGVLGMKEVLDRWVPAYYLWLAAAFAGMLLTPKTGDGERATAWYCRQLSGC